MFGVFAMVAVMAFGVPTFAQGDAAKTFEHYEAIRVALSGDELKGVAEHATKLAPMAEALGGAGARKAADGLAAAGDIKVARERFGALSTALLPKFKAAALDGVFLYTCGMVNQSWAQRGEKVQNPYMGKSMATCGSPYEPKK